MEPAHKKKPMRVLEERASSDTLLILSDVGNCKTVGYQLATASTKLKIGKHSRTATFDLPKKCPGTVPMAEVAAQAQMKSN